MAPSFLVARSKCHPVDLVRGLTAESRIGKNIVNQKQSPANEVWGPEVIIRTGRLKGMAAVDEDQA